MPLNVVVIGAGVGGQAAALGLARRGHKVTVIERDPAPSSGEAEGAFAGWTRPSVPQARQPHGFSARTRNLLLKYAPDVVERLLEWGIEEWNTLDLAPGELREPSDDQFTGLMVRRLPFELALRQAVDSEASIEMRNEAVVDALVFAGDATPPTVTGVRLRDGTQIRSDMVIDAGGRRSPVVGWLGERGISVPADVQDCEMVYYGRYYRQRDDSDLPRTELFMGVAGDLGYLSFGLFPGDNRSLAIFIGTAPWDRETRALRHNRVWDAVCATIPRISKWSDPEEVEPITDVQPMAGHQNVLRRFVVDGEPLVLGLLPVGDALCTTNPQFGWGASLALTYAFSAVECVGRSAADLRALALDYDASVYEEAESHFTTSAAQDRIRTYAWKHEEIPEHDREEAERQDLMLNGLFPAMRRDMHVLRVMMRRIALIDHPDAVFEDEQAMATAREVAEWRKANRPPDVLGPKRDEMLSIMAAAEAGTVPVAGGG